jgi:dynein heavy chain, axonemal
VQGLQEDLSQKMIVVNQKRSETEDLIKKVGEESAIAEEEQEIANIEEEKTNKVNNKKIEKKKIFLN